MGDGVICETVDYLFSKENETFLLDISGRTKYEVNNVLNIKGFICSKKYEHFKKMIKKVLNLVGGRIQSQRMRSAIDQYKKHFQEQFYRIQPDAIIFAGGQMFMGCFLEQIDFIVKTAEINGIPVFFNACGCGEINGFIEQKILNSILNNSAVQYISVRDGYDIISNICMDKEVTDTFDTAVLISQIYKAENRTEVLGLGIMISTSHSINTQVRFWKKIIRYCIKNEIKFQLFTNGAPEDQLFAYLILKKMGMSKSDYLIKRPNTPQELVSMISKYKAIISMRLHSLIIAYSLEIPSIAISWGVKVEQFYNKIQRSQYCCGMRTKPEKIFDLMDDFMRGDYDKQLRNNINRNIIKNIRTINDMVNL
ncbi:polysaccharide pyruvyl transferase family protein [[Clostridium] hylemonae]|uniref:polysaccharide pyruvyl transferase family protein n=1 Tax=[Clostridium] hylemonae TaxID=89153 RepID=UPI003993E263